MKQLVSKSAISGWREPKEHERSTIDFFEKELRTEQLYHVISILLSIFIGYAVIKFVIGLMDKSLIQALVIIVVMILTLLWVLKDNIFKIKTTLKIRKAIQNGEYTIENCYINHIEHKLNTSEIKFKTDRFAYIHNDLNEYCTEPIQITEEVEESTKHDYESNFIILKIKDEIYKILEII